MKKKKLTATIISTAIGISTVIPVGIPEITTYADTPVTFADAVNKLGDVNNDDAVDATDSSIVLEEYSLLSTGKESSLNDNQKKAADVDKSGEINASDATIILAYYSYVSTGGQLDIEQFMELMLETPVQSTTTTTATTTSSTTTSTSTATSNTTISTSAATSSTTTSTSTATSNITASTSTATSNTTTSTSTATSNTTASTSTATSNSTTTSTSATTTASAEKVSEIILNRNEINIAVGQSERITDIKVIPQNAVNQEMKWTSSDDSIAIVNNLGWIIGKKAGQCKVIIQSADNPNVFAVIIVNVSDGEPITTTSTSETTTATSSETTTETTSTTTSETTTTSTGTETTATTNIKVTEISVSQNSFTISVGGKNIPMVTMYPANASDKGEIWVSSDEKIATVDKYGWIKGISVGECKVTVYSVSDPSVYAEIEVKVVDEEVPVPEFNFSYVLGDKSDAKNIAFYTPIPKDVSGRFSVDYAITDSNGKITKLSYAIFAPEMNSIVTPLTAETNNFNVTIYVTNLETNDIAQIGTYEFSINPRDAKTITENIPYAFSIIGGLNK
ncbi:MAG: Ig-like domain-containing protein [Ruminococcus sp.]|nr:Ig-like domain-containing protein [Ruminococcus sp.]